MDPVRLDAPSLSVSRASSSTSSSSTSRAYSSGDQDFPQDHSRSPSETTLFSIYSMYGRDSLPPVPKDDIPAVRLTIPETFRRSVIKEDGPTEDTDSAYFDLPPVPSARLLDLTKEQLLVTRPTRVSSLRPISDYTTTSSSSMRGSLTATEERRASTSNIQLQSSRESSPRPDSLLGLPPLPPSRTPTPSLSPPPPAVSPTLPLKHPFSVLGSKTSLVPSEGEDLDGFHVRNTYAQLEVSGVKGDGWEEGVERTRARIGASRASQMMAENAIGDGTEKSQELDPREIRTLREVDRYGFFSIPSHDRLVLLPSAPFLVRLSVVQAGPPAAGPSAKSLESSPPARKPPKELSRIEKWTRMMLPQLRDQGANALSWHVKPSKEAKLRVRVYKGIPDRWRPAAWDMFMSTKASMGPEQMSRLAARYRDGLDKPSTYDIQIDLDVPRTISGHVFYRTRYGAGQRSLFHVLHSFSLHCGECGYVQGMGPIAATLLCYLDPEKVYASLVRLHDAYGMHTIFSPGFPGLLEAIYVQERITETMMPAVYAAFKKHSISTTSYATKWYITLFANSVPFQTQLRLWDAFLFEGTDLFVAVAVAIVWAYRDHITSSAANFETILSLLSSFFIPEDEDTLLLWMEKTLGDKKLRQSMVQWRVDWKGLVASGKDGAALL
ncbi:unnamed protein product [Mycena citricolor]|uniref:Rab-GAP TBC domain-containing protein n=1 Tax=Mycena citricolor TaxID=2018698 RepID=A0AAD2K5X9_9AGAR|nr:unnamed protein product [Mycena citricolor]